jgi:hypothetical protein
MPDKRWYYNGSRDGLYYEVVSTLGNRIKAMTSDSATALVTQLNQYEQRLEELERSLNAVKRQCDQYDEFGCVYDPEGILLPLASRVHEIITELQEKAAQRSRENWIRE